MRVVDRWRRTQAVSVQAPAAPSGDLPPPVPRAAAPGAPESMESRIARRSARIAKHKRIAVSCPIGNRGNVWCDALRACVRMQRKLKLPSGVPNVTAKLDMLLSDRCARGGMCISCTHFCLPCRAPVQWI